MDPVQILEKTKQAGSNEGQKMHFASDLSVECYPFSIRQIQDTYFFLGAYRNEKSLFILFTSGDGRTAGRFEGTVLRESMEGGKHSLKFCPMHHANAEALRALFPYACARVLGTGNSVGMGDRLGLANPGHIRAVKGSGLRVVLAQQSIRELTRTKRKPEDVMDAASWAVFQEGFEEGFGADADHLKTAADVDLLTAAAFTMFTIDPGEHVNNAADKLDVKSVNAEIEKLPWKDLEDTYTECLKRYGKPFVLPGDLRLAPTEEQVSRALVKYGRAIAHIFALYKHLSDKKSGNPFELEASVDETESVTSPFDHFFIASELRRLGVLFVSLAPRFIGDFEKGIDYKGDLKKFEEEYKKHVAISLELGPYKISLHSGSDKFSLYNIIGKMKAGTIHVKTAGTSWLVALQTISMVEPDLFRHVLDFAKERYPTDRQSYFVSGRVEDVPAGKDLSNSQLPELFNQNSARQILHVTFGSVLAAENEKGESRFKDSIFRSLKENESTHYRNLENHLKRHIQPFIK